MNPWGPVNIMAHGYVKTASFEPNDSTSVVVSMVQGYEHQKGCYLRKRSERGFSLPLKTNIAPEECGLEVGRLT